MQFMYVIEDYHSMKAIENEECNIHNSFIGTLKICCYITVNGDKSLAAHFSDATLISK